jgi:hypothetical protein
LKKVLIIFINKKFEMLGLEMCTFGLDDGYPESICRSFRKGFLKEENYL